MTYTAINGMIYITRKVSRGYLSPPDFDIAEYWTFNPSGGRKPWFMRAASNGGRFWNHEKPEEGWEKDVDGVINDGESDHRRVDSGAELRGNAEGTGGRESRRSERDGDTKSGDIRLQEIR
jgi:hypothetical protein